MQAETLLRRLDGVREMGQGKWQARCPAHNDNRASLSIGAGDNGGVILKCHANCETTAIVDALGLKMSDLMAERNGNGHVAGNGHAQPETVFEYRDESGKLRYQAVRKPGKRFLQRQPAEGGGWTWNLQGVERILYRLPELLASDVAETVFITEGEKDCEALRRLGLVATCNSGGAGKWRDEYSEALRGRNCVILPDADTPGKKHGEQVAASLHGIAESVRVLELPDLQPKGDVSDWLQAGGTAEALRKLVDSTGEWEPGAEPEPKPAASGWEPRFTDVGNGQRLARAHGRDLHYVESWKKWLVWDGTRWKTSGGGAVVERAKDTIRGLYLQAAKTEDTEQRERLAKHASKSEHSARIGAMIDLAKSEPGIPVLPEDLDQHPWLFNAENGTVDLRTGELRAHQRDDLLTQLAPVRFDPEAECPIWEQFLLEIFLGARDLIGFVQRLLGYCLTGSVRDHVLPILHGSGSNGKSTLINAVVGILGENYATEAPPDLLLLKRGGSHPTERAALYGKRMVTAVETGEGRGLAEQTVKMLTGSDTISCRRLFEDFWTYQPTHKVVLATNHKPTIRGTDHALWRRLRLVPFNVTVEDHEQDKELPTKLEGEREGILAWMVRGCLDYQRAGLEAPEQVKAATAEYRGSEDTLGAFLTECCRVDSGCTIRSKDLYAGYKQWNDDTGETPRSQRRFGKALTDRGFSRFKSNGVWYSGLTLIAQEGHTDDT